MAKSLTFRYEGRDYALEPIKLTREKLYGWSDTVVLDQNNQECKLVSIEESGAFIIPKGCLGLGVVNAQGEWVEKSDLLWIDEAGDPARLVPSSFEAPIDLSETVSIEEFLDHEITSVYTLQGEGECSDLIKAVAAGSIYTFLFNYRADYEGDPAFLMECRGALFILIGKKVECEFVGLEEISYLEVDDAKSEPEPDDELDFEML